LYPVAESFQDIAVIGAAINGLVTANYVQRAGHQVTLLEDSDRYGGAW
jgi:phytoene dehydrogenase-like protein